MHISFTHRCATTRERMRRVIPRDRRGSRVRSGASAIWRRHACGPTRASDGRARKVIFASAPPPCLASPTGTGGWGKERKKRRGRVSIAAVWVD